MTITSIKSIDIGKDTVYLEITASNVTGSESQSSIDIYDDDSNALITSVNNVLLSEGENSILLSANVVNDILNYMYNKTSINARYQYIHAQSGGYVSDIYITSEHSPVFNVTYIECRDSNDSVVEITGNDKVLVENYSIIEAPTDANTVTCKKGARIDYYIIELAGVTSRHYPSSPVLSDVVNVNGFQSMKCSVYDTRGFSSSITFDICIQEYSPIKISKLEGNRNPNDDSSIDISLKGKRSPVSYLDEYGITHECNNVESLKYRYGYIDDVDPSTFGSLGNEIGTVLRGLLNNDLEDYETSEEPYNRCNASVTDYGSYIIIKAAIALDAPYAMKRVQPYWTDSENTSWVSARTVEVKIPYLSTSDDEPSIQNASAIDLYLSEMSPIVDADESYREYHKDDLVIFNNSLWQNVNDTSSFDENSWKQLTEPGETINSTTIANIFIERAKEVKEEILNSVYGEYVNVTDFSETNSGFEYYKERIVSSMDIRRNVAIEFVAEDSFHNQSTKKVYIFIEIPMISFYRGWIGINKKTPKAALDIEGSVMINGSSLFSYSGELATDYDLNYCTDAGYRVQNDTPLADHNYPTRKPGLLEVISNYPLTICVQKYYLNDATTFHIRIGRNSGAEEYNSTSRIYNRDDYAIYDGDLYKCASNNVYGAWDSRYWQKIGNGVLLWTSWSAK